MRELREHNENMLRNILPSHVARHFLEKDRDNEVLTHTYTLHTVKGLSKFFKTAFLQFFFPKFLRSEFVMALENK